MGVASSHCHAHHTADRATVLGGGISWERAGADTSLFILKGHNVSYVKMANKPFRTWNISLIWSICNNKSHSRRNYDRINLEGCFIPIDVGIFCLFLLLLVVA
jgi:hypothetical protein